MNQQNTRRSNTQTQNNIVVNQLGHPELVSGSSTQVVSVHKNCHSLISFWKEGSRQLFKQTNGQKGDPRQHSSGMTPLLDTPSSGLAPHLQGEDTSPLRERMSVGQVRGFTLIELLVVVLIIGILAAVALPQYQKAVMKSKAIQVILFHRNVMQALDRWVLENGVPEDYIYFTGENASAQLDIDVLHTLPSDFLVGISISNGGEKRITTDYKWSYDSQSNTGTGAGIETSKDDSTITKMCGYENTEGEQMCAALCSLDSGFC